MYLSKEGNKVYALPVLEDYVDISGDEAFIEQFYTVYVVEDIDTDTLILGKENFSKYPTQTELKWCLYKYGVTAGSGSVYAKVSRHFRLEY